MASSILRPICHIVYFVPLLHNKKLCLIIRIIPIFLRHKFSDICLSLSHIVNGPLTLRVGMTDLRHILARQSLSLSST